MPCSRFNHNLNLLVLCKYVSRETFGRQVVSPRVTRHNGYMNNNQTQPNPQTILAIAVRAAELEELLKSLGTMPSYENPTPANLPDLPWNNTVIANLYSDLMSVSRLCDDEIEQEKWGITWEMVDEMIGVDA